MSKLIVGQNDLETWCKNNNKEYLLDEWDYEKNGGLKPANTSHSSGKKVWWKCSKGHEWQAVIADRNDGDNCPYCFSKKKLSFPEYTLWYYLKQIDDDWIHTYKDLGFELDLFNPILKIGIEYDGYFWHKNKVSKDILKNKKCKENNIKLYRIRESLSSLNDTSIDIEYDGKHMSELISTLIKYIYNMTVEININKSDVYTAKTFEENSLMVTHPKLVSEWNYKKNGDLRPTDVTCNSRKKVWWECSNGHKWRAVIRDRNKNVDCPYCSNQKVLQGFNDLVTMKPKLAKEWNYEKNSCLKPTDVKFNSDKTVWWKCSKGHEWQAIIADRNNGNGCPYCSNQKVLQGYNDLVTTNPELASEWNYKKNGNLKPTDVTCNYNKKVWWKCPVCNHESKIAIRKRIKHIHCPNCHHKPKSPRKDE